MKHQINVNGIKCYGFHGCLEEEGRIGGNYVVDVQMITDFTEAARKDDLNLTIDYCDVAKIVQDEMAIRSKLIEHVGQRILDRMKNELKNLFEVTLIVRKISPPIQGDVANVEVIFKG
ncbi:MAG: dihydroneopterin aldolase [Bacteroidota bacterium]